ncbi:hypothetical protein AB0I22_15770 [Streptomyces sp. NPDC050610]|uniref:hypothetical protein n=1 Tax=Streptomyces sp. NPDC050610 TaxID=3157097 RepID=UPI0034413CED
MKTAIAVMGPYRRIVAPATPQRIRSTLNAETSQQLITFKLAAHVELEAGKRPKALVWTEERILHWKRTGEKPSPVMVWTPEHTGLFLDHVAGHRLYARFRLVAFRGLRRGEACGQRWIDALLDAGLITVAKQLVVDGSVTITSDTYTRLLPEADLGDRRGRCRPCTARMHRLRKQRPRSEARARWGG